MPLVRISFNDETTREHRRAIADGVYDAMRETLDIPEGDRFQVLTGHAREELIMDPDFLGIVRTRDAVLIQIFLSRGRSVEKKQALYRRVAWRASSFVRSPNSLDSRGCVVEVLYAGRGEEAPPAGRVIPG